MRKEIASTKGKLVSFCVKDNNYSAHKNISNFATANMCSCNAEKNEFKAVQDGLCTRTCMEHEKNMRGGLTERLPFYIPETVDEPHQSSFGNNGDHQWFLFFYIRTSPPHLLPFPFSLPPFYISIIRCLGVLEGLAIQVDPKFRIISDAYPYIASRLLTDPQPDMQEALKRLALTKEGELRWDRLEGLLQEGMVEDLHLQMGTLKYR